MSRREPGDWDCNSCGNTGNFKSRTKCRRCGKGKYDKVNPNETKTNPGSNPHRSGDWICPGCNFLCYSYKTECSKCKIKKTDTVINNNNNPINNNHNNNNHRDGDWDCPDCGTFQFSRNKFCRDCGRSKDNPGNTVNGTNEDSDEDIGTQCVVCMDADITIMLLHGDTGHTCVCYNCAAMLVAAGNPCPMCRRPIDKYIRNYQ